MSIPRRIMIIDDNLAICESLTVWLETLGYDAISFTDGCSALATIALEAGRSPLDLVLLDMNMPGMDGMAVLQELRRRHRDIPVIMMSGGSGREAFVEAVRAGARDYVTKPMDLMVLQRKCRQVLGEIGFA